MYVCTFFLVFVQVLGVHMYVCTKTFRCVCMFVCMYLYMYVHMYVCTYGCMYLWKGRWMNEWNDGCME